MKKIIPLIHYILFIFAFAAKALFDAIFVSKRINIPIDNIKYILILLDILLYACEDMIFMKKKIYKREKFIFGNSLKNIIIIFVAFSCISIFEIIGRNRFTAQTLKELFYFILPGIYTFFILNNRSEKEIDNYFKAILSIYLCAYFIEIYQNLSFVNLKRISYSDSYSPFESSLACGAALSIFFYFLYRKDKIKLFISYIFVLMTFKRLAIIFSTVMLILSMKCDLKRIINKRKIIILKIFFILAPIAIYYFLRPQYIEIVDKKFNIDLDKFLMGRDRLFNSLLDVNYTSFGYGSTTAVIKAIDRFAGHMHLDLVKIYMETTIVGLAIFVNYFWNVAGKSRFGVLIMLYSFFNLLTSHSLTGSFSWLMIYMIIGVIERDGMERNNKMNEGEVK